MNDVESKGKRGRPMKGAPIISPEAKRLTIVYNEFGGTQRAFAELFGLNQSSISRMMNGMHPIPLIVISVVCYKLGYSASWFITGTGSRKAAKDEVKLVTEVSMLRTEMEIMLHKNSMLEARQKYYESELDTIKKRLETV